MCKSRLCVFLMYIWCLSVDNMHTPVAGRCSCCGFLFLKIEKDSSVYPEEEMKDFCRADGKRASGQSETEMTG